ncbi:MAG: MBL fold metallo-hydrolase [Betaproteobacteria bacterium]|nr:MBL fold metallo-hydrolase [Betaproteobacteria bacterium]MCC7217221.1 MBL fold metallo-hydrolase [Burkholderiales bacterium]
MQITFLGATRTVTGAKYLVEDGATRILVDCGLFQGEKALRLRNWAPLPVPPHTLSAVVLTHAHLDHSGYVPLLVQRGFRGAIHCSEGTHELCRILLPDSGRLQEEEAAFANRHGYSKHAPALPLYTEAQAQRSLGRFVSAAFDRDVEVAPHAHVRFRPAGHILGASLVTLTVRDTTIVFTGDLGRPHDPVMRPPATIASADYLVVESTYGDRLHEPGDPTQALADVVNRTIARGGKVVIPSFAVGRAQALLHALACLKAKGAVPPAVPVYLDSPMATDVTALYVRLRRQHRLSAEQCAAIGRSAHLVTTPAQSRALDLQRLPMVIIAASGMATGGRVLHHLRALAGDPRNTILFSGYQASGTRGAAIVSGAPEVKMLGQWVPIRAEVATLQGLSAHADHAEILQWLRGFDRAPKTTFVTHGEATAADALRQRIVAALGWKVEVPDYLQAVSLD